MTRQTRPLQHFKFINWSYLINYYKNVFYNYFILYTYIFIQKQNIQLFLIFLSRSNCRYSFSINLVITHHVQSNEQNNILSHFYKGQKKLNLIEDSKEKNTLTEKKKRKWQTHFDVEKEIQFKIINTPIRSNKPEVSMIAFKSNETKIKKN